MKTQPAQYEPVEFVDKAPNRTARGGNKPLTETVTRTLAKVEVVKEKRNWVTGQILSPQGFRLVMWVRQSYEPTSKTIVRLRGSLYTIQSKEYVNPADRKEWALTIMSNGKGGADTGTQQTPAVPAQPGPQD